MVIVCLVRPIEVNDFDIIIIGALSQVPGIPLLLVSIFSCLHTPSKSKGILLASSFMYTGVCIIIPLKLTYKSIL